MALHVLQNALHTDSILRLYTAIKMIKKYGLIFKKDIFDNFLYFLYFILK